MTSPYPLSTARVPRRFVAALAFGALAALGGARIARADAPVDCRAPLSGSDLAHVAAFVWAGCPEQLGWPHDAAIRMSGPSRDGKGSVHGFVSNYYSPAVVDWLKRGRPKGGVPDGALILKQMYDADPHERPTTISSWAIMVKDSSRSFDGWWWGWIDLPKDKGGDGAYGAMLFDPSCVACHGSAIDRELTFSALDNLPSTTSTTSTDRPRGHARVVSPHASLVAADRARQVAALARLRAVVPMSPDPLAPLPSQTSGVVGVGAKGPTGFVTSDACSGCHDAANLAFLVQPPMTLPVGATKSQTIYDLSPFAEWSRSMMGLSGRDPIFQAQLESEKVLHPELADFIDDTCYACHGVMGQRQLHTDQPGATFTHATFLAESGPEAPYGGLARDGVSCTVCHRMTAKGLGTEASFTGKFEVGPPTKIAGPYADPAVFPMQNALGMTPAAGDAIKTSKLCGSCHVVETPVLQVGRTYTPSEAAKQRRSEEQTTYLEWRNSAFQDEAPAKGTRPQRCQDCHMPQDFRGEVMETQVASIEDATYVDAKGQPFPGAAPAAAITLKRRRPYSRHGLYGANVFVLEMFKQFPDAFGLTTGDRNLDTTNFSWMNSLDLEIAETAAFAGTRTATVAIVGMTHKTWALEVALEVKNLTGHKLPTGVGFRRAFVELLALDANGRVVWGSGLTAPNGELVDLTGKPLVTERSKWVWQRHWDLIDSDTKVQIYEERVREGRGPTAELTTSFFALSNVVKDNRLMPAGWKSDGPFAKKTEPVDVLKDDSPGYFDGTGSHLVRYRIPSAVLGRVSRVQATLWYQSIPPYWIAERRALGGDRPATARLSALVDRVSYAGTPVEGWKLRLASTAAKAPPRPFWR